MSQDRASPPAGAIDCDLHVAVPGMKSLLPYMSQAWRELITSRGTDGLELASYPPGAPLSCRPDWRPAAGKPDCKRPPSDYIRQHIWFTSQPMEEPEQPDHLRDTLGWIGWDRIIFATDYPHWDYDDPSHAFPIRLSDGEHAMIFRDNALALYRL